MNLLQHAIELNKQGFKVIPVNDNKQPLCKWKQYQGIQTIDEVKKLNWSQAYGMALLTGGDIEVIDIDSKYALDKPSFETAVFDAVFDAIGEEDYSKLVISQTQSGGYHIIYRCEKIEGNQKLASRYTTKDERQHENDKVRVLLETRGENGYILIPPTPKYHFDNKSRNLSHITTITGQQRDRLISILRSFDETGEIIAKSKVKTSFEVASSGKSTIEAFNEAHTPVELIESIGWDYCYTRGENDYFVRSGKHKKDGISASFNNKLGLLYVFSTSTVFEANKAYNAFQTYAYINHNGDQKAASKELYKQGYGDRINRHKDSHKDKLQAITQGNEKDKEKVTDFEELEKVFNDKFNINIKPQKKPSTLFMYCSDDSSRRVGIGGDGDMITFCGLQKTRKSAVATCAASCFITGGSNTSLKFEAENPEGRNLIYIDTEQSKYENWWTCNQMLWQQGLSQNRPNFHAFRVTELDLTKKIQFLDYVVKKVGNVGCVLLDGIVDLCQDYNDQKESRALVEWIRRIASINNFLLINVLHNARSTGKARGHLGTELLNKGKCNINITKDKEMGYSTLEIDDLRGSFEPKGFDFNHSEQGNIQLAV